MAHKYTCRSFANRVPALAKCKLCPSPRKAQGTRRILQSTTPERPVEALQMSEALSRTSPYNSRRFFSQSTTETCPNRPEFRNPLVRKVLGQAPNLLPRFLLGYSTGRTGVGLSGRGGLLAESKRLLAQCKLVSA